MINGSAEVTPHFYTKLDVKKLRDGAVTALRNTMYELEAEAKRQSPVDTGNMRRSHSSDVIDNYSNMKGVLKNSTKYWPYVYFGTRYQSAQPWIDTALANVDPVATFLNELVNAYNPD